MGYSYNHVKSKWDGFHPIFGSHLMYTTGWINRKWDCSTRPVGRNNEWYIEAAGSRLSYLVLESWMRCPEERQKQRFSADDPESRTTGNERALPYAKVHWCRAKGSSAGDQWIRVEKENLLRNLRAWYSKSKGVYLSRTNTEWSKLIQPLDTCLGSSQCRSRWRHLSATRSSTTVDIYTVG